MKNVTINHLREKRIGWGLSTKLTAAYSILILLVAGSLTGSLYIHLRKTQRQAIRDRVLDLVSLAAPQIDSDYHSLILTPQDEQNPYYKIIWKHLQGFQAATKGIQHIYTLRKKPDGTIVYVISYSLVEEKSKIPVGQALIQLTPLLRGEINNISAPVVEDRLLPNEQGKPVLYGYAPIIDAMGRHEGLLAIELDASAIVKSERDARNIALMTFLITLPLAVSLGWLLARRLTSPISELVAGAEAIAQGELDHTVKVHSKDEVGVLAATFNQMSQQLKESFHTLEAKVDQRTAELAQANHEINALNQRLKNENIRMSAELEVTRQLQKMILPKDEELSLIQELDIAGFMEPADEVGGDYYDIIQQNDRIKISIGDVTGHGLESGVLMIMVQTALRVLLADQKSDSLDVLNKLNSAIYDNVSRINSDKTLSLALLDYHHGILTVSGQHEEIIVVRSRYENDSIVERIDTEDLGFPIGLEANISHFVGSAQVQLYEGDVVVLYTDGITEAENINKVQYGLDRLIDVIRKNSPRSASEIRQSVLDDLWQHIGTQKVYDDITLVVLKEKGMR